MKKLRESVAASPMPGWRSSGTSLGTDAVVKRDPTDVAKAWVRSLGRSPTAKERRGWAIHAEREGLSPEEVEAGWAFLSRDIQRDDERAMSTLRTIFGESEPWAGYAAPSAPPARDSDRPMAEKKKRLKMKLEGFFFGVPKSPGSASPATAQIRDAGPQTGPAPGFPFRTRAAERIWTFAQIVTLEHPEAKPVEVIRIAMEQSRINVADLTPEDLLLLEMAIDALQNGPMRARTQGSSGPPGAPGTQGSPL